MFVDLSTIQIFYESLFGKTLHKSINNAFSERWGNVFGCTVLGLGFISPFLKTISKKGGYSVFLMPPRLGVCH